MLAGGKAHVPNKHLHDFRMEYAYDVENGIPHSMCEVEPSLDTLRRMKYDLDHKRYDRFVTLKEIATIVKLLHQVLGLFFPSGHRLGGYLLQRENVILMKNGKRIYSSGQHIVWRWVVLSGHKCQHIWASAAYFLQRELAEMLEHYVPGCELLDSGVYRGGLRLPYSRKFEACSRCHNESERESCFRCRSKGKFDLGRAYKPTHEIMSADGSLRALTPEERADLPTLIERCSARVVDRPERSDYEVDDSQPDFQDMVDGGFGSAPEAKGAKTGGSGGAGAQAAVSRLARLREQHRREFAEAEESQILEAGAGGNPSNVDLGEIESKGDGQRSSPAGGDVSSAAKRPSASAAKKETGAPTATATGAQKKRGSAAISTNSGGGGGGGSSGGSSGGGGGGGGGDDEPEDGEKSAGSKRARPTPTPGLRPPPRPPASAWPKPAEQKDGDRGGSGQRSSPAAGGAGQKSAGGRLQGPRPTGPAARPRPRPPPLPPGAPRQAANWLTYAPDTPQYAAIEHFIRTRLGVQQYSHAIMSGLGSTPTGTTWVMHSRSHYCQNYEDDHRGRTVYFKFSATTRTCVQKCTCKCTTTEGRQSGYFCKDYTSEPVPVPLDLARLLFGTRGEQRMQREKAKRETVRRYDREMSGVVQSDAQNIRDHIRAQNNGHIPQARVMSHTLLDDDDDDDDDEDEEEEEDSGNGGDGEIEDDGGGGGGGGGRDDDDGY